MTNDNDEYKDYIDFKPKAMSFLNNEQTELGIKYGVIIKALREKCMTAKEIHDLYIDEDTKKHTCTLKTIYRYLERLEEADIVKICGHRITKGKSLSEKLYSRTAKTFFKSMDHKRSPKAMKNRKDAMKKIHLVLGEVSEKPIISVKEFENIFNQFINSEIISFEKIAKTATDSDKLQNMYSELDIDYINYINDMAARFLVLMNNSELIRNIQKIKE